MIDRILLATAVCAALSGTAAVAGAQTPSMPRVDARQQHQDVRIDRGVASGRLTPGEANRLEAGQAKVDALERRALSDGAVTNRERARLGHAQDVQSRRIARNRHDRQHDFDRDGRVDRPGR